MRCQSKGVRAKVGAKPMHLQLTDGGRGILSRAGDQAHLFLRASSRVFGADTDGKEKRQ